MHNISTLDDLYDNLNNGDLVLFKWKYAFFPLNFLHFTHVGIIICINNDKYILETHLKGDTKHMNVHTGGVHMYKLKERINLYNGRKFILKINKMYFTKQHYLKLINNLNKYYTIPFDNHYIFKYIILFIFKIVKKYLYNINWSFNTHRMCCSEFIAYILKDIGVITDQSYNISLFIPQSFLQLKNGDDYIYTHLYEI